MKFVALLRGINVGKSIQIPMKTLKGLLEGLGFTQVSTYLNSGNAIFEAEGEAPAIATMIEDIIEQKFGQRVPILVKTAAEILAIAALLPPEWQNDDTQQTYVAYLFEAADQPGLIAELPIKREFVKLIHDHKALIWNIQREHYNRSQITKIVGHKSYSQMTTRNSNTARKLAELCREPE